MGFGMARLDLPPQNLTFTPMYSREQASKLKQEFWTTFGQYMALHSNTEGRKVNWVNYKTGYRGLFFKMDADNKHAFIGIVLSQKDADLRTLFWEQLLELKGPLHAMLEEEWQWENDVFDFHGKAHSQVFTTISGVNIFKKEDWPRIFQFLKPRLLALDEFWSVAQYHFQPLAGL
jgi:hypothetical protein